MDRATGIFVEGMGAAATSGVLTQLQGRIFALLYLHQRLATVVSAVGWIVLVGEALWHGGFHFFAFTLGVAGAVVAVEGR